MSVKIKGVNLRKNLQIYCEPETSRVGVQRFDDTESNCDIYKPFKTTGL